MQAIQFCNGSSVWIRPASSTPRGSRNRCQFGRDRFDTQGLGRSRGSGQVRSGLVRCCSGPTKGRASWLHRNYMASSIRECGLRPCHLAVSVVRLSTQGISNTVPIVARCRRVSHRLASMKPPRSLCKPLSFSIPRPRCMRMERSHLPTTPLALLTLLRCLCRTARKSGTI